MRPFLLAMALCWADASAKGGLECFYLPLDDRSKSPPCRLMTDKQKADAIAWQDRVIKARADAAKRRQAAAAQAAAKAEQDHVDSLVKAMGPLGGHGECRNKAWVDSQNTLHDLIKACRALYLKASPAARGFGLPDLRLRDCTTRLWYKDKQHVLNMLAIMYHSPPDYPWERDAWQTCVDGDYSRLRDW